MSHNVTGKVITFTNMLLREKVKNVKLVECLDGSICRVPITFHCVDSCRASCMVLGLHFQTVHFKSLAN